MRVVAMVPVGTEHTSRFVGTLCHSTSLKREATNARHLHCTSGSAKEYATAVGLTVTPVHFAHLLAHSLTHSLPLRMQTSDAELESYRQPKLPKTLAEKVKKRKMTPTLPPACRCPFACVVCASLHSPLPRTQLTTDSSFGHQLDIIARDAW
jgi:hypothetical protein